MGGGVVWRGEAQRGRPLGRPLRNVRMAIWWGALLTARDGRGASLARPSALEAYAAAGTGQEEKAECSV